MWHTKYDQALNNLAVTEENKLRIVEAGALQHYTKLLGSDREEHEQQAAAHGISMLAPLYKRRIIREPGCLKGCQFTAILCIIAVIIILLLLY